MRDGGREGKRKKHSRELRSRKAIFAHGNYICFDSVLVMELL